MEQEQVNTTQESVSTENQSQNTENQSFDWKASLPDEFRNNPIIQQTKDIQSLASQVISGETELGKARSRISELDSPQVVKIPDEKAEPEAWNQFYNKLGRPESPEGYGFEKPDLPAEVSYDENLDKWYSQKAHELGLTKAQASKFRDSWNELVPEMVKTKQESDFKLGEEKLKQEFGDSYKEKVNGAVNLLKSILPENEHQKFVKELDSAGLTYAPTVVKALNAIIEEHYSESQLIDGSPNIQESLQDLEKEMEDFRKTNGAKLVNNDGTREHLEVKKRFKELSDKLVQARLKARG